MSEAKRLRSLEKENRRFNHVVAHLTLDNQMLKALNKIITSPAARREAAFHS